jgi:hypothetical protein
MHLAASGAPAAVKSRAVDPAHTVKIFPVQLSINKVDIIINNRNVIKN